VRIIPARSPGLYLITQKNGERSFTYWRDTSAARQLADDHAHLVRHFEGADAIHFSGITLGILTPTATDTLLSALQAARRQGRTDAAEMFLAAARVASIVLPGLDDEAAVFGPCTPEQVAGRYQSATARSLRVRTTAVAARARWLRLGTEPALRFPATAEGQE
jgi:2-dehydro-3-deoxygluconokinase